MQDIGSVITSLLAFISYVPQSLTTGSFWLIGLFYMVAPCWTGVRDLSRSTILRQDLLRKTLVPPLVPAWGALVACLTGLVTLTSTRIYDLHYSTYTSVLGSVSIHILRTVVLDYRELLAHWFILQSHFCQSNTQQSNRKAGGWRTTR
jgi:hypothetical protein